MAIKGTRAQAPMSAQVRKATGTVYTTPSQWAKFAVAVSKVHNTQAVEVVDILWKTFSHASRIAKADLKPGTMYLAAKRFTALTERLDKCAEELREHLEWCRNGEDCADWEGELIGYLLSALIHIPSNARVA